jgi:ABC-type Fe3+-hydroxamate transport system substrate-binding protein
MAENTRSNDQGAEGALEETSSSSPLYTHPRVHASRGPHPPAGLAVPRRIVSLVPSLSESLVRLGLGDRLVGVTRYCVQPEGAFERVPKLGGTKDADVDAVTALSPDLVIANQEENTERIVRRIADRGIDVWVTYPRTVGEGVDLLEAMAGLGAAPTDRAREVEPARRAYEQARSARSARSAEGTPGVPVFCPIWRDPWMTIGADTYIHDLLTLCGGVNVFAGGGSTGDRRYPIIRLEEVDSLDPEVVLLPDEPYRFTASDAATLARRGFRAGRTGRIHLIDGTLLSWYGPRITKAIQVLAAFLARRRA